MSAVTVTVSDAAFPRVVLPCTDRVLLSVTAAEALRVVNAPVLAEVAPIVAPSIVPPFISAVSATRASTVAVPSKNKSLNSKELVPKSMSLSVTGTIAPSCTLICSTAALDTSTKNPMRLLLPSTTTLFRKSKSRIV